jgi:hypothetical protein
MSDDPMAIFGNTTKGGHRGPSELKIVCPNPECRRYIARYPCPYCRYKPGALDRESPPAQPPWWESECDIVDGEVILRSAFYCDDCGKAVRRFRHREYAYEFFTFSPHWCQQCQDKRARR